eukprot:9206623-Alexandrium_andersonii.AAC.1
MASSLLRRLHLRRFAAGRPSSALSAKEGAPTGGRAPPLEQEASIRQTCKFGGRSYVQCSASSKIAVVCDG